MIAVSIATPLSIGSSESAPPIVMRATINATTAPARPSRQASVRSHCSIRPVDAPSDRRSATSAARSIARASNRLATLAHAMSSTKPVTRKSNRNPSCASFRRARSPWEPSARRMARPRNAARSRSPSPTRCTGYSTSRINVANGGASRASACAAVRPGSEPSDDIQPVIPAVAEERRGSELLGRGQRQEDVGLAERRRAREALRCDADDDRCGAVHSRPRADHGRIRSNRRLQ